MHTELGELGHLDALTRIVEIAGLNLIEAGCGAGDTARGLAERGATVLAVEPDAVQVEKNRTAPPTLGVTFVEAGAEALAGRGRQRRRRAVLPLAPSCAARADGRGA